MVSEEAKYKGVLGDSTTVENDAVGALLGMSSVGLRADTVFKTAEATANVVGTAAGGFVKVTAGITAQVGECDGVRLGAEVVGEDEGVLEGAFDGALDGDREGAEDMGDLEGDADGDVLGDSVTWYRSSSP